MTTISSNDSGPYLDYSKRMDDYEDEMRSEDKKQKERDRAAGKQRDVSQIEAARKQEASWKKTVENARNDAAATLHHEREVNAESSKQLQRQLYDRYGRNRASEMQDQQQTKNQYESDIVAEQEANRERLALSDREHDQKISEIDASHRRELEDAVAAAKTSGDDSEEYHKKRIAMENAREAEAQHKIEAQAKRLSEDSRFQDLKNQEFSKDVEHSASVRLQKSDAASEKKYASLQEHYAQAAGESAEQLRDSHAAETANYREQLRQLGNVERNARKDYQSGRSDAMKDYSAEVSADQKRIGETYKRDVKNYKDALQIQDDYYSHLNDSNLREKDAYWAAAVNQEMSLHHDETKELARNFDIDRKQMEMSAAQEKKQGEHSREMTAQDLNEKSQRVAEQQLAVYQEELARQKEDKNSVIAHLSADVHNRSSSDDISLISPAAERKLRENISSSYETRALANENRDRDARDHLQESSAANLKSTVDEQHALRAGSERAHHLEQQRERKELQGTITDTEYQKNVQLREKDQTNQHFVDKLGRTFARTQDKQRGEYEEILAATRQESQISKQDLRQQMEFQARMSQRAFAQKQNEIIRDYEKKLSDQKADADLALQSMREMGDQKVREVETKTRHEAEDMNRATEQRIAQLEAGHAERERMITRNYEDEMDKLKRSNALHSRQKS